MKTKKSHKLFDKTVIIKKMKKNFSHYNPKAKKSTYKNMKNMKLILKNAASVVCEKGFNAHK